MDVEPLASQWGARARGLSYLKIDPQQRRQGMATFLFCEAMKEMKAQSIAFVEAQAALSDEPAMGVLRKVGFRELESAVVFCKDV